VLVSSDRAHPIPLRIAATERHLVLAGPGDSILFVYDRSNGRLKSTFGRRGAGPGEFRDVTSLQPSTSRSGDSEAVWAFDATLGRLTELKIHPSGEMAVKQSVTGRFAGQLVVFPLGESNSVGMGSFSDRRVSIFDSAGTKVREVGELPLLSEGVPASVAQEILQPSAVAQPNGLLVAIGARYAGRVDIYSSVDGRHTSAAVPDPFSARVNVGYNGAVLLFRSDGQTRFGYIGLAATSERVYALFSGRTRRGFPGRANFGRALHVFSWSGRLLRSFELDRDVISIAVAPDGRTLYAIAHEPSPEVLSFRVEF
jgi:hypothetical protein